MKNQKPKIIGTLKFFLSKKLEEIFIIVSITFLAISAYSFLFSFIFIMGSDEYPMWMIISGLTISSIWIIFGFCFWVYKSWNTAKIMELERYKKYVLVGEQEE